MATRRQRERKTRQRAWHNEIDRKSTGLPLINVWFDEPYSFGAVPGPGYDWVMARQRGVEDAEAFNRARLAVDDRCDMSRGYHSTPHRGCILR